MELAVVELLNFRTYVIVPNVSWGLGLNHECDLLAMDTNHKFTEIEIKISKSDLMKDFEKGHGHQSRYISRLIYAVPQHLVETALKSIPDDAGLISVEWVPKYGGQFQARWVKKKKHKQLPPVPQSIISKFLELGCMRIWTLKQKLYKHR